MIEHMIQRQRQRHVCSQLAMAYDNTKSRSNAGSLEDHCNLTLGQH